MTDERTDTCAVCERPLWRIPADVKGHVGCYDYCHENCDLLYAMIRLRYLHHKLVEDRSLDMLEARAFRLTAQLDRIHDWMNQCGLPGKMRLAYVLLDRNDPVPEPRNGR